MKRGRKGLVLVRKKLGRGKGERCVASVRQRESICWHNVKKRKCRDGAKEAAGDKGQSGGGGDRDNASGKLEPGTR